MNTTSSYINVDLRGETSAARSSRSSEENPSGKLASHLPALRRYALAVSDSQESADAVVYAALSTLVEDKTLLALAVEPQLVMFRTFYEIWASLQQIVRPEMGSLNWAAFLLTTMESFSPEETAFITGRSRGDVYSILQRWLPAIAESEFFGAPADKVDWPRALTLECLAKIETMSIARGL